MMVSINKPANESKPGVSRRKPFALRPRADEPDRGDHVVTFQHAHADKRLSAMLNGTRSSSIDRRVRKGFYWGNFPANDYWRDRER
ncbi:hypothetical protein OF829_08980 [Sphingomonas sp. LB-2]|uniref:hypothetical protein n=1 Tax=Sphingomonas caeni TaxID=2984949 RepID=UPI00222EE76E|nr:hypothetical protein [Sphingomonas caeni]MCW3847374.1 hypothetical protein [Sphingomonas caeni]